MAKIVRRISLQDTLRTFAIGDELKVRAAEIDSNSLGNAMHRVGAELNGKFSKRYDRVENMITIKRTN